MDNNTYAMRVRLTGQPNSWAIPPQTPAIITSCVDRFSLIAPQAGAGCIGNVAFAFGRPMKK